MKDLIDLQAAHVTQITNETIGKSAWKVRQNITSKDLHELPANLNEKDVFACLDFARKFELIAFNAGIQFQKQQQSNIVNNLMNENKRLANTLDEIIKKRKINGNAIIYHIKRKDMPLNEGYIGVTTNSLKQRFEEHKKMTNQHLKNAFNKYKDIYIDLIDFGTLGYCLNKEKELRPQKNIGWNIAIGGGKPPIPQKGRTSNKIKEMLIERNKTLSQRPEQRERLSKLHKGKIISEEHKKIISETHKGKPKSKEQRKKMSKSMTGLNRKKITCPHCGKESIVGNIVRWHNDNCKYKTTKGEI